MFTRVSSVSVLHLKCDRRINVVFHYDGDILHLLLLRVPSPALLPPTSFSFVFNANVSTHAERQDRNEVEENTGGKKRRWGEGGTGVERSIRTLLDDYKALSQSQRNPLLWCDPEVSHNAELG